MIIGFVGFIGCGKGTAGDILVEHGYRTDSYAKPLKDALAAMFDWPRDLLEGDTVEGRAWRNEIDPWWADKLGIPNFTPRYAMQVFGTDVVRGHLNEQLWVYSLENRIRKLENQSVVVTDVRFPNEINLVRRLGGKVYRPVRGPDPDWWNDALSYNINMKERRECRYYSDLPIEPWDYMVGKWVTPPVHISEWAWIGTPIDGTIDNNGTVDEFREKVLSLI